MREREVVRVVAEWLRKEGCYPHRVRYGQEQGPDIKATLPSGRQLWLEAKGDRVASRPQERRAAVGEALLQGLSAYGEPGRVVVLAFPYNEGYERLLRGLLAALKALGLHLVLVNAKGEVWHLGPDASGFFPQKPRSLVEVLDEPR